MPNENKTTEKQIEKALKKEIKNLSKLDTINNDKLFTKIFFNVLSTDGKDSYEWDKNLDKELSNLSIIGTSENKSYESVYGGYGSGAGRMVHFGNYSLRVVKTLNNISLMKGSKVLPDFNKIINLWKNKFEKEQGSSNYKDLVNTDSFRFNRRDGLNNMSGASLFSGIVSTGCRDIYLETIFSNIKKEKGIIPKYTGDFSIYAVDILGHGSNFVSQETINKVKDSKDLRTSNMLLSDSTIAPKFRRDVIFSLNGLSRVVNECIDDLSNNTQTKSREVLTVYNS